MSDNKHTTPTVNFSYSSASIHSAEGAEKHRLYPAQYLGSDDAEGILNQFIELYDNNVDECVEYYAILVNTFGQYYKEEILPPLEIHINVAEDWTITMDDWGRGVPCDYPVDEQGNLIPDGEPGIFPIYEKDSAGGKAAHGKGGYSTGTSGQHGAGAAVSKSCTRKFIVTARSGSGNGVYTVRYNEGQRDYSLGNNGLLYLSPLEPHPNEVYKNLIPYTGTKIEYLFDDRILSPTTKGQPTEPYKEHILIERIKVSLMGIPNRNSVKVILNFKGNVTEITPYDMTPESCLGVTDNNNLIIIPMQSNPVSAGTKGEYSGNLYLYFDPNNLYYKCTTVVNRLMTKSATPNEAIEQELNDNLRDMMKELISSKKDKNIVIPDGRSYKPSKYYRAMFVMNLPIASFSKQTKDDLKSSEFIPHLRESLGTIIMNNKNLFKPFIDKVEYDIKVYNNMLKEKAKIEAEKKKNANDRKIEREIEEEINNAKNSLEAQAALNSKTKNLRMIVRPSLKPKNISKAVFFEGNSGSEVVNELIDNEYPITSVVLTGKLPNIYDKKNRFSDRIKYLRINILSQDYVEYLLMLDPDPDGSHIRTQLIATIAKYRPDMLLQEKVFVIRAPYAKISVNTDTPIEIENEIDGKRSLGRGIHYIFSYTELSQVMCADVTLLSTYSGVFDILAKSAIPIKTLLEDPQFKIPIKAPTKEELAYLEEMLTPASEEKRAFTSRFYTERYKIFKYLNKSNRRLKVKYDGKKISNATFYQVTESPNMTNYQSMSLYNI